MPATTKRGVAIDLAVVCGLIVLTAAARRHSLPLDGLGQDDGWVFAGVSKGGVGDLLAVSTNHPGFSAVLMVWSRLISSSTDVAPVPVLIVGVATPAILYVGLRCLHVVWPAGLIAGVALAMAATHVQFSGRVKPYVIECFSVLLLGFVVQRLSRVRWTWWIAGLWIAGAVVLGTVSVFVLVATAVAAAVLVVTTDRGDRVLRVVALGGQAVLQLAYFTVVQRSYAAGQLAKDWGGPYDGYIDLTANPVNLVREIARHASRLGVAVVGGGAAIGLLVVLVAVFGLALNARRGARAPVARFLLGLLLVAFVGALIDQIPFGPLDYAGGFRASVWLAPSVLVGVAFTVDALFGWARRAAPTSVIPLTVAAGLVAVAIVVASAGDPPPYLISGSQSAAEELAAVAGPDSAIIMFPLGVNPYAAEPGTDIDIVADSNSLIGFRVQPTDPRVWVLYFPPWDGSLAQLEEHIGGASEVVIYDGIAGFGDQQLAALEKSLGELGFHQDQSDRHGFAEISVWVR